MLLSDISIFRLTIDIGEHRVIVRGIMSLYYDILSFYFTSCYDTITSYDIAVLSYSYLSSFFFPSATCPVCCDVIFILHHPVFTFRSVISVCFRGESENAAKRRNRHNG